MQQPALRALLRNVFSSAAREAFFCPPPPYGWNMYSEKFERDPVTLRPPPSTAASPVIPLADLSRLVFPIEPRDCDRPMLPERRADNTQNQLQITHHCSYSYTSIIQIRYVLCESFYLVGQKVNE